MTTESISTKRKAGKIVARMFGFISCATGGALIYRSFILHNDQTFFACQFVLIAYFLFKFGFSD